MEDNLIDENTVEINEPLLEVENALQSYGFCKIGQYELSDNEKRCVYSVKKTERLSLVYAFVVNGEVQYIGKTIRGYSRPLSYLSNKVMRDVQEGIFDCLEAGHSVEVFVKTKNLDLEIDGLNVDIAEGYEQALISKFKPAWNNHIR